MKKLLLSLMLFCVFNPVVEASMALETLSDVNSGENKLYKINDNDGISDKVFLLVNGIDNTNIQLEWTDAFKLLKDRNEMTYFFKWSNTENLNVNKTQLLNSVLTLKNNYPEKDIVLFSHSAGGVISLLALDELNRLELNDRVYVNTIASPIYGYGAPKNGEWISLLFAGHTTIKIGQGLRSEMKSDISLLCKNWITTNCELDKHSCQSKILRKEVYPQLGQYNDVSNLPCGTYTLIDDEDHVSIIQRVVREYFN